MGLDTREIAFLQHLVAKGSGQKSVSQAAQALHRNYKLGQIQGSYFLFTQEDSDLARRMLVNEGLPLQPASEPLRRSEAAHRNPAKEKSGTLAPHANSVAVKNANGHCTLGGYPICNPGYQVLTADQAAAVDADVLLVVENLESFRFLERVRWIDYQGLSVLAVFRGDNTFKGSAALEVIASSSLPVWAYFDFDPAGLGMASRLPRLQRLLLPPHEPLTEAAQRANQVHLFSDQRQQWEQTLETDLHPLIAEPWGLLKRLKKGLAQELMDSIVVGE